MMIIDNIYIHDDIKEKFFVCQLDKCKGACCIEGDAGAPLEKEELAILEEIYPKIKSFLDPKGIKDIEKQGYYVQEEDGSYSTPTIKGRECAYAIYDNGVLQCGIEKAYLAGKIDFKKPISCHLYPIRITRQQTHEVLAYDKWEICKPACLNGKNLGVPLYQFLKDPLIRKYGKTWYKKLIDIIKSSV